MMQAAAAMRIAGKSGIVAAAGDGDIELVRDHHVVHAVSVHHFSRRCCTRR
jgi:hypothetical protein